MATAIPRSYGPLLGLLLLALCCPAAGARGEEPAALRAGWIFEGRFAGSSVTRPLEGARRTELAAFFEWDYGVRSFTEESWNLRGFDEEGFHAAALRLADEIAGTVEPELVRDSRGVVEYAVLADENPFLTSALLSPKLVDRLRETLGDRIHAVALTRQRVYLFPATGGKLADYGPALVEEFRRARLPVSLEVFLLDGEPPRAVGELERQ